MRQLIPLDSVVDVLREPMIVLNGERYFVVATAWTSEELSMIDFSDDAFSHRLIRIDNQDKGLPREFTVTFH